MEVGYQQKNDQSLIIIFLFLKKEMQNTWSTKLPMKGSHQESKQQEMTQFYLMLNSTNLTGNKGIF